MTIWDAGRTMRPDTRRRVPRPIAVFGWRRTWGELLYAVLGLPLGIAGFVFTVVTLSLGAGLAVTFVGLPLLAVSGLIGLGYAGGIRGLANSLVGAGVPAPVRPQTDRRGFAWIVSRLTDGAVWRSRLYLLLKLPLGIASFTMAVALYAYGLGGVSYWFWRPFLPCQGRDGGCHRGTNFGPHYWLDTPFRIALVFVLGVLVLLAAPWVVRATVRVDTALIRGLLGPSAREQRVQQLEHTRAVAVDDAATTLRRIERDLHDGTQARLVALAMNVGLAKEKLAEGSDPEQAQRLLDTAHLTAKQAIAEVRDLARGIHPPVLDAGLDHALETLASHSAVPVTVRTALPQRPAAAIETIAYFCAAELLTNAAKHARARSVAVDARTLAGQLVLTVSDDGCGGARIGGGTGLAGLQERVRTVDGTLDVDSPPGGPTTVTVRLPTGLGL
ncbi:MAG: sensor histidine kinase [Jatrophihabitantaceae bacterium]